jgi:hypothetical protein
VRGGVRRAQNAESSGPWIRKNSQRRIRHHTFEGFARRELTDDRLRLDALHDRGGVNDFKAGLLGHTLEHRDRRAGREVEATARGVVRASEDAQVPDQQQREQTPPDEKFASGVTAGSGKDRGAGHGAGDNISLPGETDEWRFHAK